MENHMKNKQPINQKQNYLLWRGILIAFSIFLGTVLICCLPHTQNNLPLSRMLLLPALFLLFIIVAFPFFIRMDVLVKIPQSYLLTAFLLGYGILLFLCSVRLKCDPVGDSASVYAGALYMAGQTDTINWAYFARCNNNIVPMLYLSLLLRLGSFLGLSDGRDLVIFFNVIEVIISLYCVFRICQKDSKRGNATAWLGMLMLAVYFPILGHTQSTYTDAFSFCFGILSFYLWSRNADRYNAKEETFYLFLGKNLLIGMLFGLGTGLKATAMIPLLAIYAYFFLAKGIRKGFAESLKNASLLLGCFAVVFALHSYTATLPCEAMRDTYGTPSITYFIGIGLEGDGGYTMESEYYTGLAGITGMENKTAWSREYILSHLDQFVNPSHLLAKLRNNFASGILGASDFVQNTDNPGFLYQCLSYDGAYFYRSSMLITGFYYLLLAALLGTCIRNIFAKTKELSVYQVVPILSVLGIMLYVMLSEANNRQLYNQLPLLICASASALQECLYALPVISYKKLLQIG